MTAYPRTGRPLQALAVLGAVIAGWLAGRWPLLQQDVQAAVARAERSQMLADAAVRSSSALAATGDHQSAPTRLAAVVARPAAAIWSSRAAVGQQLIARSPGMRLADAAARIQVPAARAPAVGAADAARQRHGRANIRRPDVQIADAAAASPSNDPPVIAHIVTAVSQKAVAAIAPLPTAHDLATRAYAALASGNRSLAARDFDAAIAAGSADPHASAWLAARHALGRRWSGNAYSFVRPGGSAAFSLNPGTSPGSTPLLGGSQSGAALAFALDPLARRPLDLTARVTGSTGVDQHQAEAAVGVRWHLLTSLSLSAERLIALGPGGRHDWTLRLTAGRAARIGPIAVEGYGESGIVGIAHPALFADGQALAGYPVALAPAFTLAPGAGVWAGVQHDRLATIRRVDAGPSLRLHWARAGLPVDLSVDYRRRVAGKAAPGSGAALTLSTGF